LVDLLGSQSVEVVVIEKQEAELRILMDSME
jgi:hypothetical protein